MKFGLEFIRKLKPCLFRYNAPLDDGRQHAGFIAQEVDEIVSGKEFGFIGRTPDGIYVLNYMEFIAPLVKAIQELDAKLNGVTVDSVNQYYEKADIGVRWTKVPEAESVSRVEWILDYCKNKKVFHVGASGDLHKDIVGVAREVRGVDVVPSDDPNVLCADIEKDDWLPDGEFDVVIAGEILEHMSNAGLFFDNLKHFNCPIIITVPSAYCGSRFVTYARDGYECVHPEHTCWYSYYTFKTISERHGFEVIEYKQSYLWEVEEGYASEGLLFVIRGSDENS